MKTLQTWWHVFKNSISNPRYYKDILKVPFSFSLKYFVILILIVLSYDGIITGATLLSSLPKAPELVRSIKNSAAHLYPADLAVTIKNGEASTNVQEPYYIPMPSNSFEDKKQGKGPANLLVIDTKADITDFDKYSTAVLLTKKGVVYPKSNSSSAKATNPSQLEVFQLTQIKETVTIDKKLYDSIVKKLIPLVDLLPAGIVILALLSLVFIPLIGTFFVVMWKMFYLLIFSFVVFIISKMMSKNHSYSKIYQLSMQGLTLPIVVMFFVELFTHISYLYTLIFIVWMVVVLVNLDKKPESVKKVTV